MTSTRGGRSRRGSSPGGRRGGTRSAAPSPPARIAVPVSAAGARALHDESHLFITHVDLPWRLSGRHGAPKGTPHATLGRLRRGGVDTVVLVVYIPNPPPREGAWQFGMRLVEIAHRFVDRSGGAAVWAGGAREARRARRDGRLSVMLGIENGSALGGSIEALHVYRRLGVRLFGPTWNGPNDLACGVGKRDTGFKPFGRDAVREAARLGMLVDVSHLGDRSFDDLRRFHRGPLIASHSNARALCDHPRNLTDDQIRTIARRGGVIGANFVPNFLVKSGRGTDIDDVIDHMEHIATVGGIDAVGVGTDFDGVPKVPGGLEHAGKMPGLTRGLLRRGWRPAHVRKALGGNFLRVLGKAGGR